MTRDELYEFTTGLTSGVQIDLSLFNTFLDVAQMRLEDMRPWVFLRVLDTTQTFNANDTYTTPKIVPTDFKEWFEETPIQLVDANNSPILLAEVPFSQRLQYRQAMGRYCVDYPNNQLFILGNITQPYTIYQNYIKISTLVSSAPSATWIFPSRFHKILALMVAIYWRKGIDYDVFNQTLADNQGVQVLEILDIMTRWDSNLQQNMQRGKVFDNQYSTGGAMNGSVNGGFVQY